MKFSGIGPPVAGSSRRAVGEKSSQILQRSFPAGQGPARCLPAPYARVGNRLAYARDRVVVQLVVLVLCSFPVVLEVGLVPNFPIPGGNRLLAIALDHMRGHLAA